MGSEIAPNVTVTHIGSVDPTGGKEYFVGKAPAACRAHVLKAYILTATARATNADNNNTFTLNRIRAASATAIGSGTTDSDVATGAALVADTPFEVALSSAAYGELAAGDVLQMAFTEGAVGQDLTEVAVVIEWACGTGEGM